MQPRQLVNDTVDPLSCIREGHATSVNWLQLNVSEALQGGAYRTSAYASAESGDCISGSRSSLWTSATVESQLCSPANLGQNIKWHHGRTLQDQLDVGLRLPPFSRECAEADGPAGGHVRMKDGWDKGARRGGPWVVGWKFQCHHKEPTLPWRPLWTRNESSPLRITWLCRSQQLKSGGPDLGPHTCLSRSR